MAAAASRTKKLNQTKLIRSWQRGWACHALLVRGGLWARLQAHPCLRGASQPAFTPAKAAGRWAREGSGGRRSKRCCCAWPPRGVRDLIS